MSDDVCGATAAMCACVKAPGHVEAGDPVHTCDSTKCTGEWKGDHGGNGFEVVSWPMPVTGLAPALSDPFMQLLADLLAADPEIGGDAPPS